MRIDKSVRVALVVAIAFFMQFLDTTAVNTAIPAMARAFGTDVIHLSTGITSYLIALAIFIPVSGWIADRFGTRNVFCAAIVFFILSSTLCGTSQSLLQFVIYRVMQGMAGAMMSPVGRLAVLKTSSKENLPVAMNYITIPALVAPIVGPLVGGYLTTFLTWRWIFYLNVPISIACVLLAWRYIPSEKRGEGSRKPFDAPGFVLSGLALAGFMYGVELFSKEGLSYYVPLGLIGGSLIILFANVFYSKRIDNPLIDYSVMYRADAVPVGTRALDAVQFADDARFRRYSRTRYDLGQYAVQHDPADVDRDGDRHRRRRAALFERTERRRAGTIHDPGFPAGVLFRHGDRVPASVRLPRALARRRQRGADQKRPFGGRCFRRGRTGNRSRPVACPLLFRACSPDHFIRTECRVSTHTPWRPVR